MNFPCPLSVQDSEGVAPTLESLKSIMDEEKEKKRCLQMRTSETSSMFNGTFSHLSVVCIFQYPLLFSSSIVLTYKKMQSLAYKFI